MRRRGGEIGDRDARALAGKGQGSGATDAAASAGHQRHLAFDDPGHLRPRQMIRGQA